VGSAASKPATRSGSKTDQPKIKTFRRKIAELLFQEIVIPRGVERQLIVSERIGPYLSMLADLQCTQQLILGVTRMNKFLSISDLIFAGSWIGTEIYVLTAPAVQNLARLMAVTIQAS
jgi:hypothetical protein